LQIFVDDEALLTEVISADAPGPEPKYRDFHFDLSKYAGQTVTLRLYHWLVDGKSPGSAYWRTAEVR
jgi:hypothetical protein